MEIQHGLSPPMSDPLGPLKLLMANRSCSFNLSSVHPETVEKIVGQLKNSKSAGLDTIDTQIIKLTLPYILPALTHIVNLSIEQGYFPSQWKIAKIIPLYKKGDPLDVKNYRPVAILPVLSKILERAVFLQIIQYMEANQLIHPNHHGFRAGHSTVTSLIQMYDKWVDVLEYHQFTGVCFLDLSAAFDTVDHTLLLEKLKLYGFNEKAILWIGSYLEGRQQTVYIEGKQSKIRSVLSGVPQGSILGPLLYTIFTNELPELVHNHITNEGLYNMYCDSCGTLCCYADDSSFSVADSDLNVISKKLTENYTKISDFMCRNKLKLNNDKTHIMLLATDRAWRSKISDDSLILTTGNNYSVNTSASENLLGGTISKDLKWTEYILLDKKSLIKQLGIRLAALNKICSISNFKTRKMITNGLFMSKLVYLIPLWGGCGDVLLRSLQVMQNKAAKLVTRHGLYTPTKTLLKECGWLSVSQLVFFHTVLLLFKTRKFGKPTYLFDMAVSADNSRYETRSSQAGKLKAVGAKVPIQSLNLNSFKWRSVRFWNMLPPELRQLEDQMEFKRKLKIWVQQNVKI